MSKDRLGLKEMFISWIISKPFSTASLEATALIPAKMLDSAAMRSLQKKKVPTYMSKSKA